MDRTLRVDHVDQFKIPREYFKITDDDENLNLNEKEIYKPTGPDGKGWGEFRIFTEEDLILQEENKKEEERKLNKKNHQFNKGGYLGGDGDDLVISNIS